MWAHSRERVSQTKFNEPQSHIHESFMRQICFYASSSSSRGFGEKVNRKPAAVTAEYGVVSWVQDAKAFRKNKKNQQFFVVGATIYERVCTEEDVL